MRLEPGKKGDHRARLYGGYGVQEVAFDIPDYLLSCATVIPKFVIVFSRSRLPSSIKNIGQMTLATILTVMHGGHEDAGSALLENSGQPTIP